MAAPPPPTNKIADASDAGRNCPYCRFAFKEGLGLVVCGVCSAHHHQDCWADNGGCAVLGCAAAPVAGQPAVPAPVPRAAPAAAPAPPAAPAAAAAPSRRPLTFALLGTVAVAGIVVATLAASGALNDNAPTSPQPPAPPPAPQPTTTQPPPPPSGPPPQSIRATVVGTCGSPRGSGDCKLSLRSGPNTASPEVDFRRNGARIQVVCQRLGENAYSSVRRASSRVWARTEDGLYGANIYLRGDGLNAFKVTLPCE